MKAATFTHYKLSVIVRISIHAAREGGDTNMPLAMPPQERISIHAAREGGDVYSADKAMYVKISIHAAREGGDGGNV